MEQNEVSALLTVIVEQNIVDYNVVKLTYRLSRRCPTDPKPESRKVVIVRISDDYEAMQSFAVAKKLRRGDKVGVHYLHADRLRHPKHYWRLRRWWNLIFG